MGRMVGSHDIGHGIVQRSPSIIPFLLPVVIVLIFTSILYASSIPLPDTRYSKGWTTGFYCKDNAKCMSFSSDFVSLICEEEVHIFQSAAGNSTRFEMKCEEDTKVNAYHYLSTVHAAKSEDSGGRLTIIGCPPPRQGYSTLIKRGHEDLPVLFLNLYCMRLKTFPLTRHHFDGLRNLTELVINCPLLSNVSADLLSGVSKDLLRLIIENTSIEAFPEGFFYRFHQLEYLDLSDNRLSKERGGLLRGLNSLLTLILRENDIVVLDDDIFLYTKNILVLDIRRNCLSTLPLSLCGLSKLNDLVAGDNRIRFIHSECRSGLISLEYMDLSGNLLLSLDARPATTSGPFFTLDHSDREVVETSTRDAFGAISNLPSPRTRIDQSNSENSSSSAEKIFRSAFVTKLDFRNNSLTFVPDKIFFDLKELRKVDLSHNMISQIPSKLFTQNAELESVYLSHNGLTRLSESLLSKNGKLLNLDVSNNRIKTLGSEFFKNLTLLCSIDLSNNSIDFLPVDIFLPFNETLGPHGVNYDNSMSLNLEGNLLETIPTLTLSRLTVLNLSRNRLTHIYANALEYVSYLKRLDLSHNLIQSLEGLPPRGMESNAWNSLFHRTLRNLTHVDLSHNQLTESPNLEFVYRNVISLNLSGNRIPGFASKCNISYRVLTLSSVEFLDLSNNSFTLSSWSKLCHWERAILVKIKHLDLSWNGMNLTPCREWFKYDTMVWGCYTGFGGMEQLEVIQLANNNIEFLPMEFQHFLPKLRLVDLRHNRIRKLWYHDFLITNGLTEMSLKTLHHSENNYVMRTVNNETYYEYPNSHHLTIDVRNNKIEAIIIPDDKMRLVPRNCEVDRHFARATILLGGNPFICSCEIFKILQYSLKEIRPVSVRERKKGSTFVLPASVDIEDLRCSEPVSVKGKAISEPETWAHHLLPLFGLCNYQNIVVIP